VRGLGVRRLQAVDQAQLVCHCRRVPYATVERAIRRGAASVADLQRATTACTRCFGCRFELEGLLKEHLGEAYHGEARISLPADFKKTDRVRPMYMPVLAGFGGYEIDTRLIVFNWEGPREPIHFRLDLMRPNAERVSTWHRDVGRGASAVIDLSREAIETVLPEGVGTVKLVLDTTEVGSLRPYFHFTSPTAVTTTHEKKGPVDPSRRGDRHYSWILPIGRSRRPEEVYLFLVNPQLETLIDQRLVWQSADGETVAVPLPPVAFEESSWVPLHEHVPALAAGTKAGAVRLDPPEYVVGFMVRHDPEAQLWRVQHL
jgi:bacterioferritin-associated ferredoxin